MVQRIHTSSHGEMVKHIDEFFNNKDLHLIMVKWCNESVEMVRRIHTSSHGEMVKHSDEFFNNKEREVHDEDTYYVEEGEEDKERDEHK